MATTKKGKEKEAIIEEDGDFFINYINKKIRNIKKKLREISDLEKLETLKKEQEDKINSKAQLEETVVNFEKTKLLYKEAQKENPDFKVEKHSVKKHKQEEKLHKQEEKHHQQQQENKEAEKKKSPEITKEMMENHGKEQMKKAVNSILNLVHVAQFFKDENNKNEYFSENKLEVSNDFDVFYEFFTKVFQFSESTKFEKIGTKLDNSVLELANYLIGAHSPALRNKTYSYLFENVEKIANSVRFRTKNGDVNTSTQAQTTGAIGSEIQPHKKTESKTQEEEHLPEKHVEEIQPKETLRKNEEQTKEVHHEVEKKHEEKVQKKPEEEKWIEIEDEHKDSQEEIHQELNQGVEKEEEEQNEQSQQPQVYVDEDGFTQILHKPKKKKEENEGQYKRGNRRGGRYKGGKGGRKRDYNDKRENYDNNEDNVDNSGEDKEKEGGYKPRGTKRGPRRTGTGGTNYRGPRNYNKDYVAKNDE